MRDRSTSLLVSVLFAAACHVNGPSPSSDGGMDAAMAGGADAATITDGAIGDGATGPIGGSRPVSVHVPPSYVAGTAMPLLVMLHGYSASGALEEAYMQLTPLSDSRGFLYAHPDGTVDPTGQHFWNATDACCNLYGSAVDDSTYLSTLIQQIEAAYTVDPKRVFLVGHSNGGYMSHRMACDHADQIAAIASLAGAQWEDQSHCTPSSAVSVVEIHGTADTLVSYDGGFVGTHMYPSAPTTASDWVTLDHCSTTSAAGTSLDLDNILPGNETTVTKWGTGCDAGGHVELWTMMAVDHIPSLSATFSSDIVDFLLAHPKP